MQGQESKTCPCDFTGKEILYGEKDIIGEGGIDLIMTGVGFVGPYGWVFSSAYFLNKLIWIYGTSDRFLLCNTLCCV